MTLRRAIINGAKTIVLLMVFVVALAGGGVLHLGLRVPQRFVTIRVNEVLATSFSGTIEILRYGRIRLGHIDGIEAEARDPDGHRVIYADGASVHIDAISLLRSFFSGDAIVIPIDEVVVDAGEVVLDKDDAGKLRLARTFEPREPSKEGGRPVEIDIDSVELRHVWVHGRPIAAPALDADITGVSGSFRKTEDGTDVDVVSADIVGRGNLGLDPSGTLTGKLHLPPKGSDDLDADARFAGSLGGLEVVADGSLHTRTVALTLDAHAPPEGLHAAVPDIDPRDAVHAYARVEGELPELRADVHASVGDGSIDLFGSVVLPEGDSDDLFARADLELQSLDASALHREAPRTRVTASLHGEVLRKESGALRGSFAATSVPALVEGISVPALSLSGELTDETITAVGRLAEPGAPTEVWVSAYRGPASRGDVHFTVATVVPDLAQVERIEGLGHGRVELFVNGQVSLGAQSILGRVSADLENIDARGVRLGFATLDAHAQGPLAAPTFLVTASGAAVKAHDYAFTGFRARAEGTPERFDFDVRLAGDAQSPSLSVAARASVKDGFSAESAIIGLRRADVDARMTARALSFRDGEVDVRDARIEGLGSPVSADAHYGRGTLTLRASTSRLDIGRVGTLLARSDDIHGYLAIDTDVSVSREHAKGKVSLDVAGLEARGYGKLAGQLDVTIDGRTLRGTAEAELGDAGRVSVSMTPLIVGGSLLSLDAWTRATGLVDAKATLQLDKALALIPKEKRPVSAAGGRLTIQVRASRDDAAALPDVDGQALSTGLFLASKVVETREPDGTVLATLPTWELRGIDGTVRLDVAGKTGASAVEARVRDKLGHLVSVDATGELPLRPLLARPRDALRTLEDTPLEVTVKVPRRSVTTLPEILTRMPFEGEIELDGTFRGTLEKPQLDVTARGHSLEFSAGKLGCEHPIDARANVRYDGNKGTVELEASTRGQKVLEGDVAIELDLPAVVERRAEPWEASGKILFTKLPLEVLQSVIRKPVRGTLTGKVEVASLGKSPTLTAALDLDDVTIDGAPLPHGNATVSLKDGKLDGSVALRQPDGRADIRASGMLEASGRLLPKLSSTQPVTFSLDAKSFRLHVLRPFVQGTVDSLDGRVDANVKVTVTRAGADGKVEGAISIRDGVFSSPQIGERFNKIKGKITMNPWGTLRLQGFSAEAPTGRLTASAQAVFDGFALKTANAKLVIKEGESIPITVQGVPMGRAHGVVVASAAATPDKKRLDVKVNVPLLEVELPKSGGAKPQRLAADPHVRTGVRNGRAFHPVALAPPAKPKRRPAIETRVTVELGRQVRVRKTGLADVTLRGRIVLEADGETQVSGRIRVVRGELLLQSKRFIIDHATVSFVGDDPANPMVVATAYWDAPDGTRVFADFSGTPKDGKLTLRSDPSLTEDQIVALLMFGSADGSFGSGQPGSELAQGVSAGGGLITQGLNEVISDVTTADITTRVDTSDSSNPKPEVAVQITSNISARLGVKVGVPGPGDNPDRATITFDWRFIRNWAVSAEVGDQGSTAVGVVWRFRY